MFGPLAMRSTQPRAAARARVAVEVDADVADVARVAGGAGVQPAAQDQAAADAGGDDHAQRVVVAAGGALPVLGRRDRHTVADQLDGQAAGRGPDPLDQRIVAPAGHVHRAHRARGGVHRAALPIPRAVARPHSGEAVSSPEHLLDGPHHGVAVLPRGRRALCADQDPAVAVHQRSGDLGAADVERGHEVGVHQCRFSPSTMDEKGGRSSGGAQAGDCGGQCLPHLTTLSRLYARRHILIPPMDRRIPVDDRTGRRTVPETAPAAPHRLPRPATATVRP